MTTQSQPQASCPSKGQTLGNGVDQETAIGRRLAPTAVNGQSGNDIHIHVTPPFQSKDLSFDEDQTPVVVSLPIALDPASEDDRYLVSRDADESRRLDMQHQLVVGTLGYRIHPHIVRHVLGHEIQFHMALQAVKESGEDIDSLTTLFQVYQKSESWRTLPSDNPSSSAPSRTIRIADIATGTGVWLFDLKQQLADLQPATKFELHGFDISDAQFPPAPDTTDACITLHVQNAKQAYPDALHGTFDVVHIRFMTMGMENIDDWRAVAQNAAALLKPGGALQWTEPHANHAINWSRSGMSAAVFQDGFGSDEDDFDVGVSFMNRHFQAWASLYSHRLYNGWDRLGQTLRDVGLVRIIEDVVRTDRIAEWRYRTVLNTIDAWSHVMAAIAALGHGYMSQEELAHVIVKMKKYARLGTYSTYDIHTLVGYKPE